MAQGRFSKVRIKMGHVQSEERLDKQLSASAVGAWDELEYCLGHGLNLASF